jgi:glucose uptake protein GlcU
MTFFDTKLFYIKKQLVMNMICYLIFLSSNVLFACRKNIASLNIVIFLIKLWDGDIILSPLCGDKILRHQKKKKIYIYIYIYICLHIK